MKKLVLLPEDLKQKIIEKYKQKKIDSINEIAKEVDILPSKVKAVINEWLSNSSLSK